MRLDADASALDNDGTDKESVRRTDAGVDNHYLLAAYMRAHDLCLELVLRVCVKRSARETDLNRERVKPNAPRLSVAGPGGPFLTRLDMDLDSAALMLGIGSCN